MLLAGAIVFAAATVLYSAAWMYYIRMQEPQVEIGIGESYADSGVTIDNVVKDSPAEAAGLKAQDRIIGINGQSATSERAWTKLLYVIWLGAHPGETLTLSVLRPGQPTPLIITPAFRAKQGAGDTKTLAHTLAEQIIDSYPILFVVVGLAVLFLRLDDPNAWLLAAVFATWIAPANIPSEFLAAPPDLRVFLLGYRTILLSLISGLFYFLFAVFPTRSPIDRKAPWLKWVFLVMGACLCIGGIRHGGVKALPFIAALGEPTVTALSVIFVYGAIFLGLLSLVLNVVSTTNLVERRKLKVILWGTAAILCPWCWSNWPRPLVACIPLFG